jgi:hypothetical protein
VFTLPKSVSIFEASHPQAVVSGGSPSPAPSVSPEQMKAWQKVLDAKNHWTLMTPEEILGIPTPEKILGLPAKDGEDNLTPEENFMRRLGKKSVPLPDSAPAAGPSRRADALVPNSGSPFGRNVFQSAFAHNDGNNSAQLPAAGLAGSAPEKSASFMGSLLNSTFTSADKPDARWGNSFGLPAAPAKATPGQLAGMERFRDLMQPAAVFERAAAKRPAANLGARDSFLGATPDFNGRGSSFTPLKNNAARPTGLSPLPSIATPRPVTPTRSAAQPELPPWMRDDSEKPARPPVRRF